MTPGVTIKQRPVGARASLGRLGHPTVTSLTGGKLDMVTAAAAPGFNPLDLIFSSLATCLAISSRIAASRLRLLDRLADVTVDVTGRKSDEEPYRLTEFSAELTISGDLRDEEKAEIAELAEEICTVSNTLKRAADIRIYVR